MVGFDPLQSSLAEIEEVEIEVVSPSIVPSGSFSELKIALSPVWCSRPTTGVPLAHATMDFVGLVLTTSDSLTSEMQRQVTVTKIIPSCGLLVRTTADTDGLRIVGRIQTNPVCWRYQPKR
ncbi:hypothetical protein TNCV_4762481 [Trichonephila clavipes]|nr:hypothetical protein TNCV_4762481 [Trichonephila clavipes]